jgi:hypothetical protein
MDGLESLVGSIDTLTCENVLSDFWCVKSIMSTLCRWNVDRLSVF